MAENYENAMNRSRLNIRLKSTLMFLTIVVLSAPFAVSMYFDSLNFMIALTAIACLVVYSYSVWRKILGQDGAHWPMAQVNSVRERFGIYLRHPRTFR